MDNFSNDHMLQLIWSSTRWLIWLNHLKGFFFFFMFFNLFAFNYPKILWNSEISNSWAKFKPFSFFIYSFYKYCRPIQDLIFEMNY